jgi:hypothetical protein
VTHHAGTDLDQLELRAGQRPNCPLKNVIASRWRDLLSAPPAHRSVLADTLAQADR